MISFSKNQVDFPNSIKIINIQLENFKLKREFLNPVFIIFPALNGEVFQFRYTENLRENGHWEGVRYGSIDAELNS